MWNLRDQAVLISTIHSNRVNTVVFCYLFVYQQLRDMLYIFYKIYSELQIFRFLEKIVCTDMFQLHQNIKYSTWRG